MRSMPQLLAGQNEAAARTVDLAANVSVKATKNGEPLDVVVESYSTGKRERFQTARSCHEGALFHPISFAVPLVEVRVGKVSEVVHRFLSGIAVIGIGGGDERVDAVVTISDRETGHRVAGSRTYSSASSNPRTFVLMPGVYTVTYSTVGKHKGHTGTFDMTVEAGRTFEKHVQLP